MFPDAASPFFGAEVFEISGTVPLGRGFGVLVVTAGQGRIDHPDGDIVVREGMTLLTRWDDGVVELDGDLTVIRCRPPR